MRVVDINRDVETVNVEEASWVTAGPAAGHPSKSVELGAKVGADVWCGDVMGRVELYFGRLSE